MKLNSINYQLCWAPEDKIRYKKGCGVVGAT